MARAVRRLCAMIAIGFAAGCGSGTNRTAPTAPAPPTQNAPAVSSLRIVLPTNSFSPGQTYQLKAELVLQDGGSRECAAEWSTDDARVATISPSGVLNAGALGYVNVSAACEGFSARVETKVAQRSPYRLVIAAVDSEVPTEFGVGAMMEFLDGGRAGEKVPAGAAIANGIPDIEWPCRYVRGGRWITTTGSPSNCGVPPRCSEASSNGSDPAVKASQRAYPRPDRAKSAYSS